MAAGSGDSMALHNPDDPGSTNSLMSNGPRLGRFSLKGVLPLLASVAVSCYLLKSYGNQSMSFDVMSNVLAKNQGNLGLALAANSVLFQALLFPFRAFLLPVLYRVKKNYKEMEMRYALAGEAVTVKTAWKEFEG